ncbi:MAG: hypothetical protein AAFO95_22915, partial [Cyanobacteria bacterium J06600_6]
IVMKYSNSNDYENCYIYNIYTYRLIKNNVAIDPEFKKTYSKTLIATTFIVIVNTFGKMYLLSAIKQRQPENQQNPQALLFKQNYQR